MLDGGMIRWQGEDITHTAASARRCRSCFRITTCLTTSIAGRISPSALIRSLNFSQKTTPASIMPWKNSGSAIWPTLSDAISGGQKQRIALARALVRSQVQERSLLLLDEPFSALDPETRKDSTDLVRMLVRDHGLTALVVSHDDLDAETLATRVFTLSAEATASKIRL